MFDIGWTELILIGVVTILVVGPKELPGMLRTLGQMVRKIRQMSSEFRAQFDEAMQAEDIKDLKKEIDDIKNDNPMANLKDDITKQFDPDINSYYSDDDKKSGEATQSTSEGDHVDNSVKDDKVVELQPEQTAQAKVQSGTINNEKAKEA